MGQIICKLSGALGSAVKAHIIPEAFYEIDEANGPLRLISNVNGAHPKRVRKGVYDHTILTDEGERHFSPLDSYAASLLLHKESDFNSVRDGYGNLLGWRVESFQYPLLKLFALSILWRAHTSSADVFKKVDIGRHEPIIKQMILSSEPGSAEDYSVHIVRWESDGFGPVIMDPFPGRLMKIRYYTIYCGRYIIYIKVDKQKTPDVFKRFQLEESDSLFLIARRLKESKEYALMQRLSRIPSL